MAPPVPPKVNSSSSSLGIRLDDARQNPTFAPGDVITGCVYRSEHAVGTHAYLTLSLIGRLWNEIEREELDYTHSHPYRNTKTVTYRSELELFWKSQSLYQGPFHVPDDGEERSWPFSVTVPVESENRFAPRGPGNGFIPPKIYSNKDQPLPPSFIPDDLEGKQSLLDRLVPEPGTAVEYYLEAKLKIETSGKAVESQSILVLSIAPFWHEPALKKYRLNSMEFERSIASQRLIPGMRDARPSFSDKARKFFRSSKAPNFSMKITVETPKVVQLENPNPIPFVVRLAALPNKISQEIRETSQTIELIRLGIDIVCETSIRPKDRLKDKSSQESRRARFCLKTGHILDLLGSARTMELTPGGQEVKLDIGTICKLKFGHRLWDVKTPEGQLTEYYAKLQPSFTTYFIQHAHFIGWSMVFDVAGEEVQVNGGDELVILPPSDYRARPEEPSFAEAPPPFEKG